MAVQAHKVKCWVTHKSVIIFDSLEVYNPNLNSRNNNVSVNFTLHLSRK